MRIFCEWARKYKSQNLTFDDMYNIIPFVWFSNGFLRKVIWGSSRQRVKEFLFYLARSGQPVRKIKRKLHNFRKPTQGPRGYFFSAARKNPFILNLVLVDLSSCLPRCLPIFPIREFIAPREKEKLNLWHSAWYNLLTFSSSLLLYF